MQSTAVCCYKPMTVSCIQFKLEQEMTCQLQMVELKWLCVIKGHYLPIHAFHLIANIIICIGWHM